MVLYNLKNKELENLYQILYQAMIDKNELTLENLLSKDFTLTHMTGLIQSKNDFINAILDNTLNYYAAYHENIELIQKSDEFELIGQSKVKAKVFGGSVNTWRLQLNLTIKELEERKVITKIIASVY